MLLSWHQLRMKMSSPSPTPLPPGERKKGIMLLLQRGEEKKLVLSPLMGKGQDEGENSE